MNSPEVNRDDVNFISGDDFCTSNRMLKAMVGQYLKSETKSKPEDRFPPIEEKDMTQIRAYFNRSTPQILQEEVAFNCLYYFGLRGRETLRFLEKRSFDFCSDGENREYIHLIGDRLSKNCKASLQPKDFEDAKKVFYKGITIYIVINKI